MQERPLTLIHPLCLCLVHLDLLVEGYDMSLDVLLPWVFFEDVLALLEFFLLLWVREEGWGGKGRRKGR
jgi:hypothetical protein